MSEATMVVGQDGTRTVRVSDRRRPRLWADAPYTITVVSVPAGETSRDDPLGMIATIAFKTQCLECHDLFGTWDKRIHPAAMPSDEDILIAAAALLRSSDFQVELDGVVCPSCQGLRARGQEPFRLSEGVWVEPVSGWIEW
jgi:hypothetical protein